MTQIRSKEIRMVPLSEIKPNPKNRNKHSKDQIARLTQIIEYQGFRQPLMVSNRSGLLVGGHGRLLAAKKLKLKEVPVCFQDFDSDEQEIAAGISDNSIASWAELDLEGINLDIPDLGPDFDIDLLGILNFKIDASENEGLTDPDEVPETPKESPVCRGELFPLGSHRLLCGDSTSITDVERLMNGKKADMLFTDPPYGDNHASMDISKQNGKMSIKSNKILSDKNLDFLMPAMNCAFSVLKENSTKMVFFKWSKWIEIINSTSIFGEPSSCCVWDRETIGGAIFRFNPVHEFIFHWGNLLDKRSVCSLKNVWRCKKEFENKVLHPTVKPIEILVPAIEVCTDIGNIILDLFLGSGSTLIACEKINRLCCGMELDPKYCAVILDRWSAFTGKDPVRLNDDGTETSWAEIKATLKSSILA